MKSFARMLAAAPYVALAASSSISACETLSAEPDPTERDAAVQADAAVERDAGVEADAAVRADAAVDAGAEADGGVVPESGMPIFLLAGQSNMEGSTNTELFNTLIQELEQGASLGLEARLVEHLRHWYLETNDGYAKYGYSDTMVAFEAEELIRLHKAGLVSSKLSSGHPTVMCAKDDAEVAPLALNCGSPFGPELMLGQVLGKTSYAPTSLIKVAKGGTTLLVDWRSPSSGGTVGPWYTKLRERIGQLKSDPASLHPACTSEQCRWAAFIWFQGENDSFDQANAEAYAQNLKHLIADVRSDVGSETLPVVIVEIGKWAQSLAHGSTVLAAQEAVVAADPHARSVVTDDLSGFYHYDPAAQLIIGERVAHALQELLP
jgi:hypothetical protein